MIPVQDVGTIEVGVHGLLVSRGSRRGVLLPQVATEHGWDRRGFLEHTCLKAGLPPRAWQEPGTEIRSFTARVFGESARENASQRREWMETYGNLVEADIS